jgi:hypothetical protein
MKRIIWIAVALLIMILILGFGLHTLNRISDVNRQRREKDAGEEFAAKVVMTTATTSIWDKVRTTTEPLPTDENGNPIETQETSETENSGAMAPPEGNDPEQESTEAPVIEEGESIPETAPDAVPEQTTTESIVITIQ